MYFGTSTSGNAEPVTVGAQVQSRGECNFPYVVCMFDADDGSTQTRRHSGDLSTSFENGFNNLKIDADSLHAAGRQSEATIDDQALPKIDQEFLKRGMKED